MELELKPGGVQERRYCHAQSVKSLLEVLSARRPAGVAGQEAEHEDPNEEKDDRVNGDLESEHGRAEGRGLALHPKRRDHPMGHLDVAG